MKASYDKPRIAILLATYEPREDWLREQLVSLNSQDYPNLALYVRDDASSPEKAEKIKALLREYITAFPFLFSRNEENRGSNATFALLTEEAEGDYFAYCDQDDIWFSDKLSTLQGAISEHNVALVCSDMEIMDENGIRTADSITAVRRHHVFHSGAGLAPELLIHNFATGCASLIRAETAKAALPFCPYMVHDHYLALYAAERGGIISLPERLLRYRVHGGNQTDLLAGVTDKKSYGEIRIDSMVSRLAWLRTHFPCGKETRKTIGEALQWAEARKENWTGHGGKKEIIRYRRFSPVTSLLEAAGSALPEKAFGFVLRLAKDNRI